MKNWTVILGVVLVIVSSVILLSSCRKKYKVDYDGQKSMYKNAKDSYYVGTKVSIYFEFIATDTDYSFYLDGADLSTQYVEGKGFLLEFVMPEHDVKLTCVSRNTMEYDG